MTAELAENSVRIYRLSPEGFSASYRKLLWQRVITLMGVALIVFSVYFKEFRSSWPALSTASVVEAALLLLFVYCVIALSVLKGRKGRQEAWNSYELVLGNDFIIRRMQNVPELEIQQNEITAIKENADGLRVETATTGRVIGISTTLEGYQDARERLSRWMPPQESKGWRTPSRFAFAYNLLTIILFVSFYVAVRSWAVIVTGLPLLIGMLWFLWIMQRSRHVPKHLKRLSLFSILALAGIVAKMISSIANWK